MPVSAGLYGLPVAKQTGYLCAAAGALSAPAFPHPVVTPASRSADEFV